MGSGIIFRGQVADRLLERAPLSRALFDREAARLAGACQQMAKRFLRGGRLIAFGRGASATDAQHVTVEFVHPVIVGKRALPAIDVSPSFEASLAAIVRPDDIVMGFSTPRGDEDVDAALSLARARGAQTFALPGAGGDYAIDAPAPNSFISQELIEILYHTLWETVHVFFEHEARPAPFADLGAAAFLYPFLGEQKTDTSSILTDVAASIRAKAAEDDRLREVVAREQRDYITQTIAAVRTRIDAGATLLMFGNGGSATDANDWAIDCVTAAGGERAIPALSLSMEPATITAVANDVGTETIFLRQLIAHGRRGDVAIAISTSGGSANVIAALREARSRGMLTVALLGYDGGEIVRQGLADLPIVVRCDYIPRIQEVHASIYLVMTEAWQRWPT
jgi:D-sedoheptulose 7-phosphate isomerase